MNKTGLTIKGGNTSRLGLLGRVLDLTDKLTQYCGSESMRNLSENETVSITAVYKAVAETIATVNTNGQGVTVTNCNFQGVDLGIKIEQAPEENIEETTQEGTVEYYDDEDDDE